MADDTREDPPAGLSEREYLVAQEMIFGGKPTPIGAKLKLSRQVVWEIMQRPHVQRYVKDSVEHVKHGNQRLITSAVGTAIATLVEVCTDKRANAQVRVSAAGHLVRSGLTQRHEVSGPDGAPVQTTMQSDPTVLEGMSEEELVVARKLMERLVR